MSDMGIGMTAAEMGELVPAVLPGSVRGRGSPGWNGPGPGDLQAHCQAARRRYRRAEHPGSGSTFTLSIPDRESRGNRRRPAARKNRRSHPPLPTARPLPARLHARILVADDNQANQQLISLRLRRPAPKW